MKKILLTELQYDKLRQIVENAVEDAYDRGARDMDAYYEITKACARATDEYQAPEMADPFPPIKTETWIIND
jgi:ElaB/YqjD/DUF883 family membrane-anchored ribosome-binding protein